MKDVEKARDVIASETAESERAQAMARDFAASIDEYAAAQQQYTEADAALEALTLGIALPPPPPAFVMLAAAVVQPAVVDNQRSRLDALSVATSRADEMMWQLMHDFQERQREADRSAAGALRIADRNAAQRDRDVDRVSAHRHNVMLYFFALLTIIVSGMVVWGRLK